MATGTVIFTSVIQNSQDHGKGDDFMVSRVTFKTQVQGQVREGKWADVKQTVGTERTDGVIEVSVPFEFRGPFVFDKLQQAIQEYYLSSIGPGASGFALPASAPAGVTMINCEAHKVHSVQVELGASITGTW